MRQRDISGREPGGQAGWQVVGQQRVQDDSPATLTRHDSSNSRLGLLTAMETHRAPNCWVPQMCMPHANKAAHLATWRLTITVDDAPSVQVTQPSGCINRHRQPELPCQLCCRFWLPACCFEAVVQAAPAAVLCRLKGRGREGHQQTRACNSCRECRLVSHPNQRIAAASHL